MKGHDFLRLHRLRFLSLSCFLTLLIGCQSDDRIKLIHARISPAETPVEECQGRIVLTFDQSLPLDTNQQINIDFPHPDFTAGEFELSSGPRDNEWTIKLLSGFEDLLPRGELPDGSRASLKLDIVQLQNDLGSTSFPPILLTMSPQEPAALTGARWVDTDGSSTVNKEDLLILEWDRYVSVEPGDNSIGVTTPGPRDLVQLAVKGDRLGTADDPEVWITSGPSLESQIILGDSPILTVDGNADPDRYQFEGSSSGIALSSTSIIPSRDLITTRGAGVSSPKVIDLTGDCAPWSEISIPAEIKALEDCTLTPILFNQFLVTGGRTLRRSGVSSVVNEAWIIDPLGDHQGPFFMNHPRKGHTATRIAGPDQLPDNMDDMVLIHGGWDGNKVRSDSELFRIGINGPEFIPLENATSTTPRFEHTSHVLNDGQSVLLVGGRLEGQLNGILELLKIDFDSETEANVPTLRTEQIGELGFPRHQHASLLFKDTENPLLFVYGGYGGSLGAPYVNFTAEHCRVLSAPEVFRIQKGTEIARPLLLNSDADLPGPRRGLVMMSWKHSEIPGHSALLTSGTRKPPIPDPFAPLQTNSCRTGYLVELKDNGRGRIVLEWAPAGRTAVETFRPCTASLPGGRILIVGGTDSGGSPVNDATIFDPVTGNLERVCQSVDFGPKGVVITQRALPLWGGAVILGADTQNLSSRAVRFNASR